MRIRKKLIVLHTAFSLGLAGILLVLLRPAVTDLVRQAETSEARTLLTTIVLAAQAQGQPPDARTLRAWTSDDVGVRAGSAEQLGLSPSAADEAREKPGVPVIEPGGRTARAVAFLPGAAGDEAVGGVFLRVRAPYCPLLGIGQLIFTASQRAGIAPVWPHRLRHTAATEMLRRGASLSDIGDVLRHASTSTTAIYAKVDRRALRALVQPWPGAQQ
jgi:integrase